LFRAPETVEDANVRNWNISSAVVGPNDGGIMAFLPIFLTRLGASATMLGLYGSLPGLLTLLVTLPVGALVDRVQDQLKVLVRLGILVRLMYLPVIIAPFFVPRPYLPWLILFCWTIKTVPDAGWVPLYLSISSRAVSPERRAGVNGTRWALFSLISATCQGVFGRFLDAAPFPLAYQIVFAVSFAAAMLEVKFFARLRVPPLAPGSLPPAESARERTHVYVQSFFEHRPFLRYLLATFPFRVALSMPAATFPLLWVRELHASNALIGLRGAAGYAALIVGYLLWGRSANRLGNQRVLTVCAIGIGAYVLGSAVAPRAIWLLPVALLWGLTASGIDVALFDLLLRACPQGKVARFASANALPASLAGFLGPLLGVAVANLTSVRTALWINGAALILSAACFWLLPRDSGRAGAKDVQLQQGN
jgi:MFS family permease